MVRQDFPDAFVLTDSNVAVNGTDVTLSGTIFNNTGKTEGNVATSDEGLEFFFRVKGTWQGFTRRATLKTVSDTLPVDTENTYTHQTTMSNIRDAVRSAFSGITGFTSRSTINRDVDLLITPNQSDDIGLPSETTSEVDDTEIKIGSITLPERTQQDVEDTQDQQEQLGPTNITISDVNIISTNPDPGDSVSVNVTATNSGRRGDKFFDVLVNGTQVTLVSITVGDEATTTTTVTVTAPDAPGEQMTVTVGGVSDSTTITEPGFSPNGVVRKDCTVSQDDQGNTTFEFVVSNRNEQAATVTVEWGNGDQVIASTTDRVRSNSQTTLTATKTRDELLNTIGAVEGLEISVKTFKAAKA